MARFLRSAASTVARRIRLKPRAPSESDRRSQPRVRDVEEAGAAAEDAPAREGRGGGEAVSRRSFRSGDAQRPVGSEIPARGRRFSGKLRHPSNQGAQDARPKVSPRRPLPRRPSRQRRVRGTGGGHGRGGGHRRRAGDVPGVPGGGVAGGGDRRRRQGVGGRLDRGGGARRIERLRRDRGVHPGLRLRPAGNAGRRGAEPQRPGAAAGDGGRRGRRPGGAARRRRHRHAGGAGGAFVRRRHRPAVRPDPAGGGRRHGAGRRALRGAARGRDRGGMGGPAACCSPGT